VAVQRPIPKFPRDQESNGSNGLIGGFTVTKVSKTPLGFVGDELRNNLAKDSIVYYIYKNINAGYTDPRYVSSIP